MLPVLVRAEAYVVARDGLSAAREFQKVLQHRRLMFNNTEGAMARLGLARAYAVSGNKAMAHGAYQDFLKLWQDADPDVPILKQARIEYGRLN